MKKYSDEHLESIEPEFIVALEKVIKKLSGGMWCFDKNTCPEIILGGYNLCNSGHFWCSVAFCYDSKICPCAYFGGGIESIRQATNLVSQWKKWAGVEE